MLELAQLIPDPQVLLALEPEELGEKMIQALKMRGGRSFVIQNVTGDLFEDRGRPPPYPHNVRAAVEDAIVEAWAWLEAQGLLVPEDASSNGQNGWRRLSRRALKIENASDFANFRVARLLSREQLHARIRDQVWLTFMRGEFDTATFQAMKAVEVAVREAASLGNDLVGTKLVRKAFHPEEGSLTDFESEPSERQGRADLFAGALASYKNPGSHRDVDLEDPAEAVEIILLANHLLRIVDPRRQANGTP